MLTITILTCTYNSAKHLTQCIESVMMQNYSNVNHVFIDGMSTDGTLEIIRKFYRNPVIYQKKDSGVYDAFNRALTYATTDVVTFLHSDDFYIDKNCLHRVNEILQQKEIDYYSAQILIWDDQNSIEIARLGAPMHPPSIKERLKVSNYYAHPTNFFKRHVAEKIGHFDLRYKIAADVDWMQRLQKANFKQYFDKIPVAKLRNSGLSGSREFEALWEEFTISLKYEKGPAIISMIYLWHFFRRGVKKILKKISLHQLIPILRKIINR